MPNLKRVKAEVSLDNIKYNLEQISRTLPEGIKKCAVVKADAYGHGVMAIASALSHDVDYFAVATSDEGLELRMAGIKNSILLLGYTWREDYIEMIENDISMTVFKLKDAEKISQIAVSIGKKAKVHIKVDTGMNRIGFPCTPEAVEEVRSIREMEGIEVEGIFTHFAKADEADKTFTYTQLERFRNFIDAVEEGKERIPLHHCANSAAILDVPEAAMDMVRIGIILYGLYPSNEVRRRLNLRPAMELKSHITFIKEVEKGQGISYNHTRVLTSHRRVATIPVGYADGYPRMLSNSGHVIIRGRLAPILGRVCMDQMMVDVTYIPNAKEGDEVTLIGWDGDEFIGVDDLAAISDRFNYEFICDIGRRVPRVY